MQHDVEHREQEGRFVVSELGHEAYLEYHELQDGTLDYAHTFTPNEIRGRGIATAIIREALDWAMATKKRVLPSCPFVNTYIDRHGEYKAVL